MQNILFFGDSLTAGYGLSDADRESFPGLIQKKIDADSLPFQVINAGVSGDTTAGGLARLEYWLNRPIHVFILELGINDIMRGIPIQVTASNLQKIVDHVKAKYPDAGLGLMGMEIPPFIPGVPHAFADSFRDVYKRIAKVNRMVFVPFFLEGVIGEHHLNLPDGLHPSAAGYKIIADRVWPSLKPLLQQEVKVTEPDTLDE